MLTNMLMMKTATPAKNDNPRYENKKTKQMVRVNGKVVTAGSYVARYYIFWASTCTKVTISPCEKVLLVAADNLNYFS